MRRILFVMCGILLLVDCEKGNISKKLIEADSLVAREEYDSAYQMVSSLDETTIVSNEDKVHYDLLKVQTGYLVSKPQASADSILDEVIAYYQEKNNKEKLADSYYYKAIGFNRTRNYNQSVIYYKKAEYFAEESGNLYQRHKIAEGLSYVNGRCEKYNLQLNYAKKALTISKQLEDQERMAYAYYLMDIAYSKLGYEDSAKQCLKELPPIIECVDKREKPYLLSNIGYLFRDSNKDEAKK